ncbi:4-hydroxy-3-methylbut-2-enyl diphosphate reductase [Deferrisoma palaeochoriense]
MEIVVARSAGFCMGVRRAIEMAREVAGAEGRTVYTHGPLIHNPQELERLKGEGIVPLGAGAVPRAPVIVRAHGIPPQERERLEAEAERVVDATCPKVSRIQQTIADYSGRGYAVIICGDADHPEVTGLLGHARGPAFVVGGPGEVDRLPALDRVLLVSQTTQDEGVFDEVVRRVAERYPGAEALNTICSSTHRRQTEARELAQGVDAVVVIGGRNSANTRRLYEICKGICPRTYHVETPDELPLDEIRGLARVGVTAGASTPAWIIEEVVGVLREVAQGAG